MKSLKKESRHRIPTNRFVESSEKKRAKVPEQPTPPIQEEPEPVSNVLQGDDILALAIKKEDLKKQHSPRLIETEDKPVTTQKFIIRKLKPKDRRRKVCHLVAHPATPDAATKPLDYSGPGDIFHGSDQILSHHILGSLHDFKRIALARGNTEKHVGIAVRLTFETLEGEKTSSELTVVNNGTVAIWYDWRRRSQPDSFQDLLS